MTYEELYRELQDPEKFEKEIVADVEIKPAQLETQMVQQSSLYIKWAMLASVGDTFAKQMKITVEETLLPLAREKARESLKAQGRKATVQEVNDWAMQESAYKAGKEDYEKKRAFAQMLKKVEDTMIQKKDMLQSINARQKSREVFSG